MFAYRMGLDVGTNSLGWSVLQLNENGEPCAVTDAGVRIFNDGRVDTSKATLKADRRAARSARRRHDRYKQRRTLLLDELTKGGLFPEDPEARFKLQTRDPLKLRAQALTEKLEPYEIGRALFHLNQRRGFKSNRKDRSKKATSGMVNKSVIALLRAMGLMEEGSSVGRVQEQQQKKEALEKLRQQPALTFGLFLWQRREKGEPTRARPNSDTKLYDVYPTREILEHEFDVIWTAQAKHHPELLSKQKRERFRTVIFTQRPLKPSKVGKCTYLPAEDRTFQAMPSFQRYRIYQEVNNLEWTTSLGKQKLIHHPDARDKIVAMLERPTTQKGNVTFGKMKNVLKEMGLVNGTVQFNFETPKRNGFDGNLTSNLMQDEHRVGPEWHDWPLEKQDQFISVILNDKLDDEKVHKILMRDYGLSDMTARECTEAPLKEGTALLSSKAAHLLMAKMRDDRFIQSEAVQAVANENADFVNPFKRASASTLLDRLPYYGEAVQGHIIPGNGDETDEQAKIGMVTNPTVHIALNQIRHVVNELIARYGHPTSIAIELGRDLPAGPKGRAEITKEQKSNQDNNQHLDDILRDNRQDITSDNRLRLRLWEELDGDPNGRCCPFSGQKIGIADLFNGQAEIEHLIPFSVSLDDSRANKVICSRQANRDKGNQIPHQAFGHSPTGYNWPEIVERAKRLPKPKQWRFEENAMNIWYRDHADFTERHLNDTRYIGRLTKEYLENICPSNRIDVLAGRLTALLRNHWGLNKVLHGHNQGEDKTKNRDDHRHHAVDAIVIGMTSRSMLHRVPTAANRAEELNSNRLFEKGANGKSSIEPWPDFRDHVKHVVDNMTVSHKPKRKALGNGSTDGQLHNDTAYGIISGPDQKGMFEVVVRKPVKDFEPRKDVERIRDELLRAEFLQALDKHRDKHRVQGIADLAKSMNIRRLRQTERLKVIPIKDKFGKAYKAYKGDSNWGIEIYEYPSVHKKAGEWDGKVISRHEANQKEFKPGQTKRPHPAARLVMRLQINECIGIEQNGSRQVMRLQKLSQAGRLDLAPHHEANVDARHRDSKDRFKYLNLTASGLQKCHARKVHVSPAGLVSYEQRRKPRRKNE